jgi:hypothetical protein
MKSIESIENICNEWIESWTNSKTRNEKINTLIYTIKKISHSDLMQDEKSRKYLLDLNLRMIYLKDALHAFERKEILDLIEWSIYKPK